MLEHISQKNTNLLSSRVTGFRLLSRHSFFMLQVNVTLTFDLTIQVTKYKKVFIYGSWSNKTPIIVSLSMGLRYLADKDFCHLDLDF